MVDFRTLALELCMADGQIDDAEVRVLKRHIAADGNIQQKELQFLIDLRTAAEKKLKAGFGPAFEKFFFDAFQLAILDNGVISKKEVTLLKKAIFSDKKVSNTEKNFLKKLKSAATRVDPSFDKLYAEVMGK